ncbi:hypothetical protein BKA93DRAFT_912237 [Sparassis latifolia]|uniref:Uncharacterized protein n=1 Tax=Sparassis crispa TaxID=139825 RepID=A0A401GN19_9APHY|nr:hypothetical protein SCP_0506470 [Sparassis crispa]GBE83592.1 hypothetical protein SCP_0506470 [Sparassis crispa]
MPFLGIGGSSDSKSVDPEVRKAEKILANEARHEQRNLEHAVKDVSKVEKSHEKGFKSADKAQHALEKAANEEHATAMELNKAEHKHDTAVADHRNAVKELELSKQNEERLQEYVLQRRSTMEELQNKKGANDRTREGKLSQLHASSTRSIDEGPSGAPTGPDAVSATGDGPSGIQGPTV